MQEYAAGLFLPQPAEVYEEHGMIYIQLVAFYDMQEVAAGLFLPQPAEVYDIQN